MKGATYRGKINREITGGHFKQLFHKGFQGIVPGDEVMDDAEGHQKITGILFSIHHLDEAKGEVSS